MTIYYRVDNDQFAIYSVEVDGRIIGYVTRQPNPHTFEETSQWMISPIRPFVWTGSYGGREAAREALEAMA